ncbi:hypothetical protein ACLMNJ_18150 [Streptomyces seoulensis]
MSGPRTVPGAAPGPEGGAEDGVGDGVGDVLRWAAFSCVLVAVVRLWCGASPAGAAGTALGLAAVTVACRALLRQSERGAARLRAEERVAHRGRRRRTGTGAHRGHRHLTGAPPVD